MTSAEASYAARLQKLDSCAVSDAMDKLGLKGCVTGLTPLSVRRRIAGRVRTVKLIRENATPIVRGNRPHLGASAIESSDPGDIIVVEQRSGIDCGSWGGLLSLGAKMRGVVGIIADGPVRDVDEANDLDFPIFARSATARTARGRICEEGTNVPVVIGDVGVSPGDFAIADGTAVIFIAMRDLDRVLTIAEGIAAREATMARALLANEPITAVLGANYEQMLK
jgi:4-hydroxy-4-methyl-2-oxoglutarate aldolase